MKKHVREALTEVENDAHLVDSKADTFEEELAREQLTGTLIELINATCLGWQKAEIIQELSKSIEKEG